MNIKRARLGVFGYFFLLGLMVGFWAAGLPSLNQRLQLGEGRLGVVLLLVSFGALGSMLIAGQLVDRLSSRRMSQVAAPLCALALLGPALAPDYVTLMVSAVVLGLGIGVVEVAINTHSVEVEHQYGRPIISAFHGTWSLGGAVGGAITSIALGLGADPQTLLVSAALVIPLLFLTLVGTLLPPPEPAAEQEGEGNGRRIPWGLVLILGVAAFAAHLSEGAAMDWTGLHSSNILGVDPAIAPIAFTIFSTAMTVVRFVGDPVRARLGNVTTVGLAGAIATGGYVLVLLSPVFGGVALAWIGWGLTGVGLATVIPVLFSAVGASGGSVGKALALLTAFGYTGLLMGPAVLGFVAEATSLRISLIIPAVFAAIIALAGVPALRRLPSATKVPAKV
ncbi:MFS family permease [Nonomuraea soli]|uniref:MFS family permease n=1 Tax=Nonomuraea soli TaxID=1032476 RepID=A0A7W0CPX0_9ACTN|nr:MFS transporter [Nonomuraea soli]MBA2895053.1 MFS family permease [Nonomuraea soli]